MQQHFNFKTGKSVNILEQITHFYINPYMPDNFKHLRIKERIETYNEIDTDEVMTVIANSEHVVTLFPIKYLASDTVRLRLPHFRLRLWRKDSHLNPRLMNDK